MSGKTGEQIIDQAIDQAFAGIEPGTDEPDNQEPDVEDEPVEDETEPEGEVEADDDDDDEADGGGEEEDPEDAADDWLVEGKFRKGDEDKLAKSYRELESFSSKRFNELQEQIKQERESAEQRAIQIAQAMVQATQAQAQQLDPVGMAQRGMQLEQAALSDPASAYQAAVMSGDDSLVQRVTARVARGLPDAGIDPNPAMAQQMVADYQSRQFHAQQQQMAQQMQQMQMEAERVRSQGVIDTAVAKFESQFADTDDLRPFIGEYLNAHKDKLDFSSAENLLSQLEVAYDAALGRSQRLANTNAPAAKQERVAQRKRQSFVTSGNSGLSKKPEPKKTAGESFADELLEFTQRERGGSPW